MTNSERITAHNARLAAMKETVAALPDAGGGGSVETCTVTINDVDGLGRYEIYYTDGSLQLQTISNEGNMQIVMAKYSYFCMYGWSSMTSPTGDIFTIRSYGPLVLYEADGDGTITGMG